MSKTVDAIVRGPRPHFRDGVLHAPGQIVRGVPAAEVSKEDFREEEVEVENRAGNMVKRTIKRPVKFRPLGSEPVVVEPQDTAEVVTGQPDRLNVTDFLKRGADDIVAAIAAGNVDEHLGAIEQAVLAGKGSKKGVREAITARLASIRR